MAYAEVQRDDASVNAALLDCLFYAMADEGIDFDLYHCHASTPRQDRCRSKLEYCRGKGHDRTLSVVFERVHDAWLYCAQASSQE
eukprot:scaffold94905_cov36-Cyclotella_meneghiniana.AAC.15